MWFMGLLAMGLAASVLLIWSLGFWRLNDFSLPLADISLYKKVLVIFPHPDDEVLTTGGLLGQLTAQGSQVRVVFLTKGERGTPDGSYNEKLKQIRQAEAAKVAKTLGYGDAIWADFGDGELTEQVSQVALHIQTLLVEFQPDLVITYDQSGLYGHPDHIVVSEVVSDALPIHAPQAELWHPSYPQAVLDMIALPEHMAEDQTFKSRRLLPTHRVAAPGAFWRKAKAIRQYASQTQSFRQGLPVPWLPFEFVYSLTPWEYFAVIREGQAKDGLQNR